MSKGIFWFPCFVGAEGELIFTDRIEVRITPETAAPNTHKDSWKAVTAGRKGKQKGSERNSVELFPQRAGGNFPWKSPGVYESADFKL